MDIRVTSADASCKDTGNDGLQDGTAIDRDFEGLPRYADRKVGAALISQRYFRVAPRTLENWPLPVYRINGRASYLTSDLMSYAEARMHAAPVRQGGRRPKAIPQQAAA